MCACMKGMRRMYIVCEGGVHECILWRGAVCIPRSVWVNTVYVQCPGVRCVCDVVNM